MQTIHLILAAMDSEQFVTGLTAAVVTLFGILMRKNYIQDKKLDACEQDRKMQSIQILDQQREVTNIWKHLAETARAQLMGTSPPAPPAHRG